jgi:hypothetical protein
MLTHKQEFAFFPNQDHSKLVNYALNLEQDHTLQVKVIYYCALNTKICNQACYIAEMRNNLFELQQRWHDSAITLAEANAYHRLISKIIFDDPSAETMTAYEV